MTFARGGRIFGLLAIAIASPSEAQTYNKDVAPILFQACAPCHRPGEAAPFSLLDYRDAKSHARQIVQVTKSRFMPPWKPALGRGEFQGERRLSDKQIATIERWVERGAPQGIEADAPPRPTFVEGWQLGKPDLVITLDDTYSLAASGTDVFRNFVLRVPIDGVRYVRAMEIRPGPKAVVHHANLLIDEQRSQRRHDRKDGSAGFAGMDVQLESRTFNPESHLLFWKPGTTVLEEPSDMAWQLEPGSDLILNMHLRPSGKPESIRPSVGLYFTDTPPKKRPMLLQLERDGALDIPPGEAAFVVTDELVMPVDADLLAVYPHGHYLARDMQATASLPDGSIKWIIHIPDWDLNWQAVYRYKQPLFLPAGSKVTMRYTYDNSAANPRNPNQPPVRVVAGDRSTNEMAHLWLQVLPRGSSNRDEDLRRPLQKALMLRRLEKYPSDLQAHFSLGAMLQDEGDLDAAIGHYRKALKADPKSPAAHNALGSALLEAGRSEPAEAEFRSAIALDSEYADAHYNLARVLLSADKVEVAVRHLHQVIRIEPNDAAALSDLGAALTLVGNPAEGLRYLKLAVQRRPEYFPGRYNLAQAFLTAGMLTEARSELEAALRLKPGDEDVLDALKKMGAR